MTNDEAYALGLKVGKEKAFEELIKALGLDELIAKAIALHEEQYHD